MLGISIRGERDRPSRRVWRLAEHIRVCFFPVGAGRETQLPKIRVHSRLLLPLIATSSLSTLSIYSFSLMVKILPEVPKTKKPTVGFLV